MTFFTKLLKIFCISPRKIKDFDEYDNDLENTCEIELVELH